VVEYIEFPKPPFIEGVAKVTISRDPEMALEIIVEGTLDPHDYGESCSQN